MLNSSASKIVVFMVALSQGQLEITLVCVHIILRRLRLSRIILNILLIREHNPSVFHIFSYILNHENSGSATGYSHRHIYMVYIIIFCNSFGMRGGWGFISLFLFLWGLFFLWLTWKYSRYGGGIVYF